MWSAYLFQTVTGKVGAKLDLESCTWSIDLNATESLKVSVKKTSLPPITQTNWFEPWWAGVVLFWNDIPLVAGTNLGNPTESFKTIDFTCSGIRSILSRRTVTDETRLNSLSTSVIEYKGLSLGTIAQRVVKVAMSKQGGNLPIVFGTPEESAKDDADHQRTYRGFNVANLLVDDVLTKISSVINGPDIMFMPRALNKSRVWFEMINGTEKNPRLPQKLSPVWDLSVAKGSLTDFSSVKTGAYQTDRVYSIGAGEDEGTLIQIAQDLSRTQEEFPLLETVLKEGDSENPETVMGWGQGNLQANRTPLQEINISVRADGLYPLGSFWPGDQVTIVTKGWLTIADGKHKARLIGMSGTLSTTVKLTVQLED